MAITEYGKYMPEAAHAGKLANYQDYEADTKAAEGSIPFGAAVQLGADGEGVIPLKTEGTPFGIALATEVHDWVRNADDQHYKQYDAVAVVRKGTIWVEAGDDVMTGEAAAVNPSNGKFYPADTEGAIAFPTATFKTKATAGNLAQVQINLP